MDQEPLLSVKSIPVRERLIFALDVPTVNEAKSLVEQLGDSVIFYKLGLEIFMAGGYYELIEWLRERKKEVFVDLKFFDVPQTARGRIWRFLQLKNHDVRFVTVHGNDAILKAAVENKNGLKILAVTVLTSLDQADLNDLGFKCDVQTLVLSRARRAIEIGCDGVISSGLEARQLRVDLGPNFLIVTPGIRPVENTSDDQKRKVDIEEAFLSGADYIVVGRPIKQAPNPKVKAEEIQKRIAALFGKGS